MNFDETGGAEAPTENLLKKREKLKAINTKLEGRGRATIHESRMRADYDEMRT